MNIDELKNLLKKLLKNLRNQKKDWVFKKRRYREGVWKIFLYIAKSNYDKKITSKLGINTIDYHSLTLIYSKSSEKRFQDMYN